VILCCILTLQPADALTSAAAAALLLMLMLMLQAEAALPPPFPSNAPLRAYISNMAVLPAARRQGIATALVGACGRIGALLDALHSSAVLHYVYVGRWECA
jgi:ribosomal protein S18 acetylase RimI-like enzyme